MKTFLTSFIPDFILEFFFPNTDRPEDFKLKVVPAWLGADNVSFEYTANGGWTWNYIYSARSPFLGFLKYDWEWKVVSYDLGNGDFQGEKIQWGSYKLIQEYHAKEREEYKDGCASVDRQRKEQDQRKKDALIKANM